MPPTKSLPAGESDRDKPPEADEFEVSIFGPGRGESLAVHIGSGAWIVVDSCIDKVSGQPAALQYLQSLGIDVAQSVRLVVATHFDVDHIHGLAKIVEHATSAEFVLSNAECGPLLFEAMETARRSRISDTGFDEYAAIFDLLEQRDREATGEGSHFPVWAVAGLQLWREADEAGREIACVIALSPSHGTSTIEKRELAGYLPSTAEPQRRPVSQKANHRSIALWVEAGVRSAILGGDLEASADASVGWDSVIATFEHSGRVGSAEVVKVPHHGSSNADSPEMWDRMTNDEPIALIAPFASSSKPLPNQKDQDRILQRTDHVFLCANPEGQKPPKYSPAVERTVRETTVNRRAVRGNVGHVRARCSTVSASDPVKVEYFHPAYQVSKGS